MGKLTPYYERNGITIYNGDCLEIMPQLDVAVDAIICDLPYGQTDCNWDTVIPFEPLWSNYKRLIKGNGAVVLFGSEPFSSKLRLSNLEWYKYDWVWEKNTATNIFNSEHQPVRYHENVLVFCNGQTCFNKQLSDRKESAKGRVKSGIKANPRTSKHYLGVKEAPKKFYDIKKVNPKSVLYFHSVPNCNGTKLHPTQKPVSLLQYLIRTYTNPGELILDNAAGSGTTMLAAQNEGRRAIGIELSEDYCRIAVDRLKQPSFFSIPDKPKVEKPEQLKLIGETNE